MKASWIKYWGDKWNLLDLSMVIITIIFIIIGLQKHNMEEESVGESSIIRIELGQHNIAESNEHYRELFVRILAYIINL